MDENTQVKEVKKRGRPLSSKNKPKVKAEVNTSVPQPNSQEGVY